MRPLVEPVLDRDIVAFTLRERTLSTPARSFLDTLIAVASESQQRSLEGAVPSRKGRSSDRAEGTGDEHPAMHH